MTLDEIEAHAALPENAGRTVVIAHEEGDEYVAEWGGQEVRAGNPFGLDSKLTAAGAPAPRNVYLLTQDVTP